MTLNTAPDTPNGLTPAAARIYTALHAAPGSTAAELARAASAGLSTTGKLLKQMEQDGLARRILGGSDNNRRLPDHWHTTTTPTQDPQASPSPDQPAQTTESTHTGSPDDEGPLHAAPAENNDEARPDQTPEATDDATGEDEPADAAATEPQTPTAAPTREEPPTGRLGQGGLRNLVHDYLADHHGTAHSPTRIARQLGRSSGAVANALVTLVSHGQAEMVTTKPRTYRATPAPQQA